MWIRRNLVLLVVLIELCQIQNVWSNGEENFYPNEENCGITERIPGDIRTQNPWNVVIYMRRNLRSPFQYFLTGTLTSANTVLTTFGGGFGQPPYNQKSKKYHIPSPRHFLIASGLPSTDLNARDEHTQFANVSYISPHNINSTSANEEYHMVVFRLSEPMRLETPYVRSICISFAILPVLHSLGFVGRFSDIITFTKNVEQIFVTGFNAPLKSKGPFPSVFLNAATANDPSCQNSYKYHYGSEPEEIFCMRITPENEVNTTTCLTHGSTMLWKSSEYSISFIPALGPEPRYHASGPVALIPRKDRGHCGLNTTYYVVPIIVGIDWLRAHMSCSPTSYPCSGKCIPLDQVCDGKIDCAFGEDEDSIFCMATNRCKGTNSYQCGLEGKCISGDEVGNGYNDCPSGSDEDPRVLESKRFSKKKKTPGNEDQSCFPLFPTEGVIQKCRHPEIGDVDCSKAPPDTEITLNCAQYYTPLQKTNYVKMKCYDDRSWKPFKSFACQPECGLLGKKVQSYIVQGQEVSSEGAFPWHAAILKENRGGTYEYICGASLIERNVLITAAHCITDETGGAFNASNFRIVLSSNSVDWKINLRNGAKILEIEEVWHPWSFNARTLQADIAILKLVQPVTYTHTVKPICYLWKKFNNFPQVNSTGTVAGFGVTETGKISQNLKYVNLNVLPFEDCGEILPDKFCAKSTKASEGLCYGDSGGGFVFPAEVRDTVTAYILKGVVSNHQTPKQPQCDVDANNISGFTHLDSHSEWILSTLESIDTNPDS
ncbi:unnamed protein product [Allacma fusca]|uniref:Peptidase S1 domain-containing protein n=1 Tax=Allacma fusca TaxID=39272 RepID=A0A8J2L273_9HEXA|nr:unnamed protein product [Allacma fusca]